VQPNGVEPSLFHPLGAAERIALRSGLADHPERTICLFVGRYVEKKGLPIMRELVRRFDDVEWWFLGWGATTTELDPGTWGLPNMKLFANRSGTSLAELYMASDLFVLPSKGEGFPLAVMESMACGTPALISSETAAAVPYVRDYAFVCDAEDPSDSERWVGTLAGLLRSGAIVQRRSEVAQFAAERWTWDQCVADYRAAYLQLAVSPVLAESSCR
jgi:glycosyltransferase involved in cell wall biosynthesis